MEPPPNGLFGNLLDAIIRATRFWNASSGITTCSSELGREFRGRKVAVVLQRPRNTFRSAERRLRPHVPHGSGPVFPNRFVEEPVCNFVKGTILFFERHVVFHSDILNHRPRRDSGLRNWYLLKAYQQNVFKTMPKATER